MKTRPTLVLLALLGATAAQGACGLARPSAESAAWVADAAARSRSAEEALDRGDLAAARALLEKIALGSPPPGLAPSDHRVVLMDAFARLAEIELAQGRPQAARAWAERGLALGQSRDVFTANLHLVHGRALEAEGLDLQAAASYHRALVVSEALLGAALPSKEGAPQ